jgi:spore coat polysaccharide biosynthesis protein SpsF
MKIISTIEARMTSSRLPGKPLLKANNKTMLEHIVDRLKSVDLIDEIVLATTVNNQDDPLVEEAKRLDISFDRGDEDNVMKRVIDAGDSANAEVLVEITGDCPIIDPSIIKQSIEIFISNQYDYVSNGRIRSYPDGMDTQVFLLDSLKKSYSMTSSQLDYEHVSLHLRNNPDIFSHFDMQAPKNLYWPELGLTLDEYKDYILIKNIIEYFGNENNIFSCSDAIEYLKANPSLLEINKSVNRKGNT